MENVFNDLWQKNEEYTISKGTYTDTEQVEVKPFPVSYIPDGWLKKYLDFANPLTEAPVQYHIATALSIVATVLGRNVWLDMGAFTVYPNLFLLVIGKSGISRKSTAIGMAYRFLSRIDRDAILGSLLSLEAFYEAFHIHPNRLAIYDEIKTLLDNEGKKYGKGIITQLTSFYNCPDYIRIDLKSIPEDQRVIERPCINLLGASTTDWLQVRERDIEGGFFGRILPICADSSDIRCIPIPPKMDMGRFDELRKELGQLSNTNGEFSFTSKARELYEGLYKENRQDFEKEPNKTHLSVFYSRLPINQLKLAMIFQITQDRSKTLQEDSILRAHHCMNELKASYKQLIGSLDFSWTQRQERKVLDILKERKEMSRSDLLRQSKLSAKDFNSVIDSLLEKELISESIVGEGRKQRKMYQILH